MKNSMDADLLQTLQTLKKQDPKIQDIIEHLQESPSELLEMLSKNLDMLDFVCLLYTSHQQPHLAILGYCWVLPVEDDFLHLLSRL